MSKKRLNELAFDELVSMYEYASGRAESFEDAAENTDNAEEETNLRISGTKWESYADSLGETLEYLIKYALSKEDGKSLAFI